MNMKNPLLTLLGVFLIPTMLPAANVLVTWSGGGSGSYSWASDANWSSSAPSWHYPDNDANDIYFAQINDSNGARVVDTGAAITIRGFSFVQSSATGSMLLNLGGNFTATGSATSGIPETGFVNSTGDASRMVIDLHGYDLNVDLPEARINLTAASNYTVRSTSDAGGTYRVARISTSATNVHIENNVSLKITGGGQHAFAASVEWSAGSTLLYAPTSANGLGSGGTIDLGNIIIGDAASTQATAAVLRNNNFRVRGDFTVASHVGGAVSSFTMDSVNRNIYVGGNFTDTGTSGDYGGGTIHFNGGAGSERLVEIARAGLSTHFRVGETAAGNIRLARDLATTGGFTVLQGSRVNVDGHQLKAGNMVVESGASLKLTFGAESGSFVSTGNLSLNSFALELEYDGSEWVDGSNLTLFTYQGTFAGVPALASVSGTGFSYGALVHDDVNKLVYLSNVHVVPEPGAVALWGAAATGAVLLRRRLW